MYSDIFCGKKHLQQGLSTKKLSFETWQVYYIKNQLLSLKQF